LSSRETSKDGPAAAERDGALFLARRPLTVAELRDRLAGRGHSAEAVDSACDRLARAGYLDDGKLAADYIVTRAHRLGHGPDRLLRELRDRGVDPDVARLAMDRAVRDGDLDPLEILRRRIGRLLPTGAERLDGRHWRRVYNALIRAGFDSGNIRRELEPYRDLTDPHDQLSSDETNDDFA